MSEPAQLLRRIMPLKQPKTQTNSTAVSMQDKGRTPSAASLPKSVLLAAAATKAYPAPPSEAKQRPQKSRRPPHAGRERGFLRAVFAAELPFWRGKLGGAASSREQVLAAAVSPPRHSQLSPPISICECVSAAARMYTHRCIKKAQPAQAGDTRRAAAAAATACQHTHANNRTAVPSTHSSSRIIIH